MSEIVIIGGCGHVGLPLGLAFAQAGKKVVGLDLDQAKVDMANSGKMPFEDRGTEVVLPEVLEAGTFRCTTDQGVIKDAEVVITVIGTPLDEHLNPRFDVYHDLFDADRSYLKDGQLFIMRSTVYPGTTEQVARNLAREGFKVDVAFCPERVAEGVALEEIHSLPQIVAGCNENAQRRAEELFRALTPDIIPMKPKAAELTKLYNNAWRYIQFAIANQFYMIANECGLEFSDIHGAMTWKYPRAKGFPKAGFAAGPCLFKDTMQLSAFNNNAFFLGHAAMLINEGLPGYLVRRAKMQYELHDMTVGILGMTFKADSDDPRDSLSYKLRKILVSECREVLCSDPYLTDGVVPLEEAIDRCDLMFIGAPHAIYKQADFGGKPVVDVWTHTEKGISVL